MIRFQARNEAYNFKSQQQNAGEQNDTHFTTLVPILHVTSSESRFLSGSSETVTSGKVNQFTGHCWSPIDPTRSHEISTRPRDPRKLPLLCMSNNSQAIQGGGAAVEAAISGGVTSSAGALLGLAAWVVGGPAGGAFAWAMTGAGIVGGTVGAAQYAVVTQSDDMREFAETCNLLLLRLNDRGIGPEARAAYERCRQGADSRPKLDLLSQVDEVIQEHFGDEANALSAQRPRVQPAQRQQPSAPQPTAAQTISNQASAPSFRAASSNTPDAHTSASHPAAQYYMAGFGGR